MAEGEDQWLKIRLQEMNEKLAKVVNIFNLYIFLESNQDRKKYLKHFTSKIYPLTEKGTRGGGCSHRGTDPQFEKVGGRTCPKANRS